MESGLRFTKELLELHGNVYTSRCPICNTVQVHDHIVGGDTAFKRHDIKKRASKVRDKDLKCLSPDCRSTKLLDTVVHYGEPIWHAEEASKATAKASVLIFIGTSCAVLSKYKFVWANRDSQTIVVCNRRWTSIDSITKDVVKVHSDCDRFVLHLVKSLGIDLNPYLSE